MPWLGLAVLFGGLVGPVLLMWGLTRTPASNAALLLNFEGALTALLAWFIFRENFDLRIAIGMALIVGGGSPYHGWEAPRSACLGVHWPWLGRVLHGRLTTT